ncbi:MAG TPA: hypothetical protein VFN67_06660 [Polyangiales bacterium]|nr:hypothetical protein [Polyangiales bacterium]
MRLASLRSGLGCALTLLAELSVAAGCDSSEPARHADQRGMSRAAAGTKAGSGSDASSRSQTAARAPAAGSGNQAAPFFGDVPARAANSGNRPCGSSEFSVGPCGGRSGGGVASGVSAQMGADAGSEERAGQSDADTSGCRVTSVPASVRDSYQLDTFYRKYANASGIPVVASDKPVDRSLHSACNLVNEMLEKRSDVRDALIASKVTFAIVATSERTTEIPEYRHLPKEYDTRARGLGGHTGLCAEESILCDAQHDPWHGESICVHEYSHTIAIYGLFAVDNSFEDRLADAYHHATQTGLWRDTFAAEDAQEYWAEGVQDWYYTNLEADPPNGVHGPVNTQDELERYDPKLFSLIDELLPRETRWPDCYRQKH